ncbi:MAG TPA: DUF2628 domain-containing protein [Rhizobiaceae bacterium]|nr:DUF2628 domain-containing protein [Rhizobiaceae bacterium]
MAAYTAYLPPDGSLEDARFVAGRFSWFALLFAPVYLLWHRLWYAFALWLLVTIGIAVIGATLGGQLSLPLSLLPSLFLAIEGPQLIRARLERLGWREAATVQAANAAEAELRFFHGPGQPLPEMQKPAPVLPLTATAARPAEASLGIFPQ